MKNLNNSQQNREMCWKKIIKESIKIGKSNNLLIKRDIYIFKQRRK